jgi:glycogen operon protein
VFRQRRFFQGRPLRHTTPSDRLPDVAWFRPDGAEMTDADWEVGYAKSLGIYLNGLAIPDPDVHGRPIVDDSFYLLVNAWDRDIDFTLPEARWTPSWMMALDTGAGRPGAAVAPTDRRPAGAVVRMSGMGLILLQSANQAVRPA